MSAIIDIGFTFNFGGLDFTQFKMNTNGWITFNTSSVSTSVYNAISSSETFVIAGFSANLNLTGVNPMSYKLSGVAPLRILQLQWKGITHTPVSPGSGSLTSGEFQIWLYETTNVFEVNYGTFITTPVANFGSYAQVGWKGECPTDGDALYKNSYPYWDTPWNGYGYVTSLSFGSSGGFLFLPMPGELFRWTPAGIPLPIGLTSFTATSKNNINILSWTTNTEMNNDHFEIERSADGITFHEIGTVEGHGNSSYVSDYHFEDISPFSGINYYRLKQVDYNGDFRYSQVIFVETKLFNHSALVIYPNPAGADITILPDTTIRFTEIEIYNSFGVLKTKSMDEFHFDLSGWLPGIYFVKARQQGNYYYSKFTKL